MVRHGNGKWRTTTHEEKKRTGTWKQETNSSPTTTRCHGSRRTTKRQRITRLFPSPPVTLIPSIYLSMPMFEGRSFSFLSQFFRHTLGWEWVVSLSPFPFENVSCILFPLVFRSASSGSWLPEKGSLLGICKLLEYKVLARNSSSSSISTTFQVKYVLLNSLLNTGLKKKVTCFGWTRLFLSKSFIQEDVDG